MLIVGCGDIGRRVGRYFAENGREVWGIVRSAGAAQALTTAGIRALRLDLDLEPLPRLHGTADGVFHFAPPPERGREDPRLDRLLRTLARDGLPQRVVLISTTGVYGDCEGAWVDETRAPAPAADRAHRRLDAERRLQDWGGRHEVETVILRVAGIYGPDRLPLARIRQGLPLVQADQAPYTNRIHEDDLARVCVAAMERPVAGETFNVSDGQPGTMAEYFDAVAARAGLPPPPKIAMAEASDRLSPGMLSYMRESRRLDNRKMRRLLVNELLYPDLSKGLDACFPGPGD